MSSDSRRASAAVPAVVGAVSAVLASPFAAALVAVVYRFPVPVAGYVHGLSGALPAAFGSLFYLLVFGGAVVVAVAGAVAGKLVERTTPSRSRARVVSVACGLLIALAGASSLALLEYVIGPW